MGRGCERLLHQTSINIGSEGCFPEKFKMESGSLLTEGKTHSLLQGSDGRLLSATAQTRVAHRGRHLAVSRKHAEWHFQHCNPESTAKQPSI